MKRTRLLSVSLFAALNLSLYAQEPAATEVAGEGATSEEVKQEGGPSQEELEAKFIATLTNATMAGRWCLIRDGKLTPEREDKYEIKGVVKTANGGWLVRSRIQYGSFDMVLPVPVKVEWAGDTPVIIVDNMGIPGGNAYSARVVIHDDSYAGTWSGGTVKGLMNGMITREVSEEGADAPAESTEAPAGSDDEPQRP
jgi:hypothetical protein